MSEITKKTWPEILRELKRLDETPAEYNSRPVAPVNEFDENRIVLGPNGDNYGRDNKHEARKEQFPKDNRKVVLGPNGNDYNR